MRELRGAKKQYKDTVEFFNGVNMEISFEEGTKWLDYHGRLVWRTTKDLKCRDHLSATYNGKERTQAKKGAANRVNTVLITGQDAANNRHIRLVLGRPVRVCDKKCHAVVSGYPGYVVCFHQDQAAQLKDLGYKFTGLDKAASDNVNSRSRTASQYVEISVKMHKKFMKVTRQTC